MVQRIKVLVSIVNHVCMEAIAPIISNPKLKITISFTRYTSIFYNF